MAPSQDNLTQALALRIGARVRELRLARGLSQTHLADFAVLHRTFIGRVERGETNVTVTTLEKICGALGVTLAEFFRTFTGH